MTPIQVHLGAGARHGLQSSSWVDQAGTERMRTSQETYLTPQSAQRMTANLQALRLTSSAVSWAALFRPVLEFG
jgi:hypothetical protein